MPLPRIVADAFGAVTISLVAVFVVLSLLCVCYSIYFHLHTRRQEFVQFGYFSGPWIARIALVLVAIWWAFGEVVRLNLLKGKGRLFVGEKWQHDVCKFYIVSSMGFAEPCLFLILVFMLHASLRMDRGALSRHWNARAMGCVLLSCIPMFVVQLVLVLMGSKFNSEQHTKIKKYFASTYSFIDGGTGGQRIACIYPLSNTIVLGVFDCVLIGYVSYVGYHMLSLVINKGLQRRIYFLSISVIGFFSTRVSILGFSVLSRPGGLAFEALVFLAFLMLLLSATVDICILVYYPVADSVALGRPGFMNLEEMVPFDDYYDGNSSLVRQTRIELGRNSDASTKRGSISFRTMIKDDTLPLTDHFEEAGITSPGNHLPTSSSPRFPSRSVYQLQRVSEPEQVR